MSERMSQSRVGKVRQGGNGEEAIRGRNIKNEGTSILRKGRGGECDRFGGGGHRGKDSYGVVESCRLWCAEVIEEERSL